MLFRNRHYGTGTLTAQGSIWLSPQNLGTEGVYGNILTQKGLYISGTNDGGTITTYYGIHHAYENSGTITHPYFIYDTSGFSSYLTGKIGIGVEAAEQLHVSDTVRADTAFNLNGTDGVTQAATAGKVCDVTALAGGIATAQTQVTYATDGTYSFDATSGKVDSITIKNGRITAITTAA